MAANPTSICQANNECSDITGDAKIVLSPAEVETFENNQTELVASGSAVNINIQDLNMTTVEPIRLRKFVSTDSTFLELRRV